MDYEKAYKKALERAKKNYDVAQDLCNGSQIGVECFKNTLTNIFPELAESEDERIRKRLIDLIYKVYAFTNYITCVEYENIIAWLEKQGDTTSDIRYDGVNAGASLSVVNGNSFDYEHATITQKDFAPKQKPKFKVGDYIVSDYCMGRVVKITNDAYLLDTEQGIPFSCEHNAHLWTIKDAKDGDVLAEDTCIFIIQKLGDNSTAAKTYCTLYNDGDFDDGSILYFDIDSTKPATKEQRELLFQKMKEAGYEWDADKKELKKVWQKLTELAKGEDYGIDGLYAAVDILQKTLGEVDGYQTDDGILEHECAISAVKKLYEQNPTWSEEDDYNLQCMIAKVTSDIQKGNVGRNNELIDWLKSLKDRVQPQSKIEWSEKDKEMAEDLIKGFQSPGKAHHLVHTSKEIADWLKSLKSKLQR